ncbi:M1 family metallopeptidase [Pontibacter ruber]|uniref:Aminopeptidase N n=1 Tax=Pontibacter ruber TaxID=1343895 RepID=A0ABW5CZR5_9BACT|nr:M1 family metallopeptidase [Pontibacter ruber]
MKKLLLLSLLGITLSSASAQENWTWGGPLDPNQAAYDVKHYTLNLAMEPDKKYISGSADAVLEVKSPIDVVKLDLIDRYKVSDVRLDGKKAIFTREMNRINVQLGKSYKPGQRLTITVAYAGETPEAVRPPWQGGFTFSKDANGKHWVGLSSQNEGAKIFMPCKDHPSDEPDEGVDQFITVPAGYMVAANGVLVSEKKKANKVTYHWKTNYTINNYSINFTVGDFIKEQKEYTTVKGNKVPMVIYLLKQNEAKAPGLMEVLETSVRTQEKYFGEYPFPKEKIGIVETPYLGMEHQTINAYGNNYKYTKVGGKNHDWLLHHELGHEWWGNKVTVSDWADFWIHEGLCSYGDWLYTEEHAGKKAYMEHVREIGEQIPNNKPVIIHDEADSDEAYHPEVYTKGAFIMHSLRYNLGDEVFFKILKGFATDEAYTYKHQVKTADFISYVNKVSGKDMAPMLNFYLRSTNLPEVVVKRSGNNRYTIQVPNIDFTLPMDVRTDKGIQRLELSAKPVEVTSSKAPVIDEDFWYLKKITTATESN